ncbi:MAG TPA: cupin domain-containing protein [Thermoleophilia bacterium]|nr:cupin domain-containing protein [Thermoleophilia bacterium]
MIIKKLGDVPSIEPPGYSGVSKQVALGPEDGSGEIVLRYFSVAKGGATACHEHDFPHLVKIEAGRGAVVDWEGKERPVVAGDYLYVGPGEIHCFRNVGGEPLQFICIVPIRGEQAGVCCSVPN